ncbi:hypothetical protein SAMN05216266_12716 [Amycolatopsis marina]|uniref:Uncharacterized protein n=1 Tax=Amycolatopsis marina TaxID=490629 RepID=A0A1I1CEB4_9PSEU|nr:hypothetical protein SAMN05216266_12716 [Amycolatopsis marina]
MRLTPHAMPGSKQAIPAVSVGLVKSAAHHAGVDADATGAK